MATIFVIFIYGVHIGATRWIRLSRPCAAAMRHYVKLLWALVVIIILTRRRYKASCRLHCRHAAWHDDNYVFGHFNEVTVHRTRLLPRLVTRYVISHSGQLGLLPTAGWEMSTGQRAVAVLCGWEGNRRSGVAPATRHRSTNRPMDKEKETSVRLYACVEL